jgi:SAM-dependent methyltransferase
MLSPVVSELIRRFCVGRGIEIGPGRNPMCDRSRTILLDRFTENPDANPNPDIVADAARIPIRDGALDFLFSSHMLEHHQDTLRTLYEWKRILKPGGIMFLVLPHHARTFDRHRAITTLQHHIDDYARLGEEPDYSHCEEIREGWSKLEDFEQQRRQFEADWGMDMWDWTGRLRNGVIHFHVWSQKEIANLLRYIGLKIEYVIDLVPELSHSFVVIGRRGRADVGREGNEVDSGVRVPQRRPRAWSDSELASRAGLSPGEVCAAVASGIFDERFYLAMYPDVAAAGVDPLEHYLLQGRFEKRRPSALFDPSAYVHANPDVAAQGIEPFLHYVRTGRAAGATLSKAETVPPRPALTREIARGARRLIIFLTPGYEDRRGGGMLSIAAIYQASAALSELHGAKVALCAVPGDDPLFLKYTWFENDNYLLDLNALLRSCTDLEHLQLHIPEYAVNRVARWLDAVSSSLLRNIGTIHLNVMLQNIDQIEGQDIGELKRFGTVTVTTGHEAYGNAQIRKALGAPLHKLGIWIGAELYDRRAYRDKEPILVVSHDEHPLKEQVLGQIARSLPQLQIRIVHNISYEEYKALISRAKWSLTFGEGLDGYFAETVFSGGNSFAVYNDRFFTPAFAALETVYSSWEMLSERITVDLQRLDESTAYDRCWRQTYELLTKLYSTDRFRENLRAFYRGEYSFR